MPQPVRIAETPPRFPLKVLSRESMGKGVFRLTLKAHPMPWQAGDCVTLFAPGEEAGRPYSFSGGTDQPVSEFWIRSVPGGQVSSFLAGCSPGDVVEASPPFGWFHPGEAVEGTKLFIATGTGIAPFLSALRSGLDPSGVPVLWGMREPLEIPSCLSECDLSCCISREHVEGGHPGRVTDLLPALEISPGAHVYLCGLDAMIEEVSATLGSRGISADRIHKEVFFTESSSAS